MKIEVMNINYVGKKLEHITSTGIQEVKMSSRGYDALPSVVGYIEKYATENGFKLINGASVGNNVQLFLAKQ